MLSSGRWVGFGCSSCFFVCLLGVGFFGVLSRRAASCAVEALVVARLPLRLYMDSSCASWFHARGMFCC